MAIRTVVITGASRGIGAALARAYAGPGIRLALVGRDEAALGGVAEACRQAGANVSVIAADIRERDAMRDRLLAFDEGRPIDLLIANAGVQLPTGDEAATAAAVFGEIDVNLVGTLNSVMPLLPVMRARGTGQIALVSSLAAFAPLPDSPGYSAAKAALVAFGLATRERLRGTGVTINVVCPGYVATPMGGHYRGSRPLEMSADQAARLIKRGLDRDQAVIAFPRSLALLARISTMVPEPLRRPFMGSFRFSYD